MAEETENEGTWSSLKKTLIGTIATVITGGGAWLGTQMFGGKEEPAPAPVQQSAPIINLNVQQNNTNSGGGNKSTEKEKVVEKETKKKKDGDEFKEKEPLW
jgi:hypothetical protein